MEKRNFAQLLCGRGNCFLTVTVILGGAYNDYMYVDQHSGAFIPQQNL